MVGIEAKPPTQVIAALIASALYAATYLSFLRLLRYPRNSRPPSLPGSLATGALAALTVAHLSLSPDGLDRLALAISVGFAVVVFYIIAAPAIAFRPASRPVEFLAKHGDYAGLWLLGPAVVAGLVIPNIRLRAFLATAMAIELAWFLRQRWAGRRRQLKPLSDRDLSVAEIPEPGQPVVLVFNGNAGNRADRAPLGSGLAAAGLGVLLTDYRGYGGNPGHPTEDGLASDARAAVSFVREWAAGSPLVYFGESLGAAVAVELASADPPAALVLRSPFTSLADMGRVHYPWLPASALLKDRYPSIERIGSVHTPTLIVAGETDAIVPVDQSRALFAAAPGPKQLLVIPSADHNDPVLVAGREMIETVVAFIAEAATS